MAHNRSGRCTLPQELARHNLRCWRHVHDDRRRCTVHCRRWRSMAHSRRRTDVLHCRGWRCINYRSQRAIAHSMRWTNVPYHKRWCGRHRVSGERDRRRCALHWSGVNKLSFVAARQGFRAIRADTASIHSHTSHDHRRCRCRVIHLCSILCWSTNRRDPPYSMGAPRPNCGYWTGRQNRNAVVLRTWLSEQQDK